MEHGRILRAVAVALGTEAVPEAREARHLPQLGEEILDLTLKVAEVTTGPGHQARSTLSGGVASIRRILGLAAAALAGLLRLWYRAVLAAPEVKRRKAARRAVDRRA